MTAPQETGVEIASLSPLRATLNKKIRHYRIPGRVRLSSPTSATRTTAPHMAAFQFSRARSAFSPIGLRPLFDTEYSSDSLGVFVGSSVELTGNTFSFNMLATTLHVVADTAYLHVLQTINTGHRKITTEATTTYDLTRVDSAAGDYNYVEYPDVSIGAGCTYLAVLTGSTTLRVQNLHAGNTFNFGPATDIDSKQRTAACLPAPDGPQCIIQEGCTLGDGGGGAPSGADAEVTGTVQFPPSVEDPGFHMVCIETDWFQNQYADGSGGEVYLGTDFSQPDDGCWFDPN